MNAVSNHTIWDFVKSLLHEHDCVIVPGFGGFVANKESARIDQVSHVITPPRKHLVFNQNLKTNDGLLANYVSTQLSLSYADAVKLIDETVSKTKDILQEKKLLTIELFGIFRLNADANYVFLPDKQNNYLYSSYGLMPFEASPVSGRTIKASKARVFKERKELRNVRSANKRRNLLITAAAAVFVAVVSINLLVLFNGSNAHISQTTMSITSWFDSLFHSNQAVVIPAEQPKPIVAENKFIPPPPEPVEQTTAVAADSVVNEIVSVDTLTSKREEFSIQISSFAEHMAAAYTRAEVAAPIIEEQPISETAITPPDNEKPAVLLPKPTVAQRTISNSTDSMFYIIGGVFCKEQNARRFFHQLEEQGYAPDLIPNSGNCNRVSYKKFSNRKDAEQQLRTIQTTINREAWLYVLHN
ncbi:MAG: hypothetical protein WCO54_02135 [Bacteroidota bacterium]